MNPTRFLILILFAGAALLQPAAGDLPPTPASSEIQADLTAAFDDRLQDDPGMDSLTFDLFTPTLDTAFISPDGKSAVLWLALRDDFGEILATEPGLAIAQLSEDGWQVLLPGEPGWEELLINLPDGMLPLELSPAPPNISFNTIASTEPLRGYYLPYAAGISRWLEGSISHFQSIPELGYPSCSQEFCRYAYDFTDATQFPLVASKKGRVVASRDSCSDGDPGCTNYIVLYNSGDEAYQIYLHLANGSIPNKLSAGTKVERGQYLGDSDDTGYSTSQHVHFMVTDSIWMGNDGYYWGRSVDVRFDDVAINNGIPRRCYEVTHFQIYDEATECLGNKDIPLDPANDWYVSGNIGAYPPVGTLTQPAAGTIVAEENISVIDVSATASDDVRVTAVRLVAKLNDKWVEIGPKLTTPANLGTYEWDVDLCDSAPVNGPLELALRIWDYEGNVVQAVDPRTIQVEHACPPPTSQLQPAETFDSTAVRLSWDAASAGAGIDSFELQWRTEPGSWDEANKLTLDGESRSTWFSGQSGNHYAFRLRALDLNNQPEPWPADGAFETSAILPSTCTPDIFEPDDMITQARKLNLGEWTAGNLCDSGNPDWFQVDIEKPDFYSVKASSEYGGAAVRITVYKEDGETILANGQASEIGQAALGYFKAPIAGSYYIKIEPLTAFLMGSEAIYGLRISEGEKTFFPLVAR